MGPNQPPNQWVPRGFFPGGVWRPGSKDNHSHLFSDDIENWWSHTSTFPYPCIAFTRTTFYFMVWYSMTKHRNKWDKKKERKKEKDRKREEEVKLVVW
jgi:hypothetical protein